MKTITDHLNSFTKKRFNNLHDKIFQEIVNRKKLFQLNQGHNEKPAIIIW